VKTEKSRHQEASPIFPSVGPAAYPKENRFHGLIRTPAGFLISNLVSGMLYSILAWVVPYLSPHNMAPVWPPAGLTAAAAMLFGWNLFPGIFLGSLFSNLEIVHFGWSAALMISVGNTVAPLLALHLFRRILPSNAIFHSVRGVLTFIIIMGFLNSILSALFGAVSNFLFEGKNLSHLAFPTLGWAIADTASTVMIAPAIYLWTHRTSEPVFFGRARDMIPALFVIFAGTLVIFLFPDIGQAVRVGVVGLLFIPFAWITTSQSSRDNATLLVPVFLVSILATAAGYGPFAMMGLTHTLAGLEILEIGMGTSILLAGALNHQRLISEKNLAEINQKLEHLISDRTRELHQKISLLQSFFDAIPNPVFLLDAAGNIVRTNRSFDANWKNSKNAPILGKSAMEVLGKFGNTIQDRLLEAAPLTGSIFTSEETLRTPFGEKEYLVNWTVTGESENIDLHRDVIVSLQDIGIQKRFEKLLQARERSLGNIIDSLPVPAIVAAKTGDRVLYLNREAIELFIAAKQDLLSSPNKLWGDSADRRVILKSLCNCEPGKEQEVPVTSASGHELALQASIVRVDFEGEEALLLSFRDITDRRRRELDLATLASTDPLTGVGNRRHFMERAEQALAEMRKSSGTLALFMIDVDHFKWINDRFGHQTGDDVLRSIASALALEITRCDRENMIDRIGGEEFATIVTNRSPEEIRVIAEHLRQSIDSLSLSTEMDETISPTISIGVAYFPGNKSDESGISDLMRQADLALYRAKKLGRNRVDSFVQR